MELIKYGLKFERLTFQERRDYFVNLIKIKTGITCEYKLYEILIRLAYIKNLKGYRAKKHREDQLIADFLNELDLNAERAMNWFVYTKDDTDFNINKKECDNCVFSSVCELKNKKLIDLAKDKYNCQLTIKRIKKLIIKKETFHDFLKSRINYSEEEIRKILRKLFIYYRYKLGVNLNEKDNKIIELLEEYKINYITVLKWFYLVKDLEVLFKEASAGNISYEDVLDSGILSMRDDLKKDVKYLGTDFKQKDVPLNEQLREDMQNARIIFSSGE